MRKTQILTAALALATCSCSNMTQVRHGDWCLSYVSGHGISITNNGTAVLRDAHSEYGHDGRIVSSNDYTRHTFSARRIDDAFGRGRQWTVRHSSDSLPSITQTFRIYDRFLLTDMDVSAPNGTVRTNYMAPVVAQTDTLLNASTRRKLFVPFDNDAWIRYRSTTHADSTLRSYEVTSVYDAAHGDGIVMGAISHDKWKNAVELKDAARSARLLSGVADKLTRDTHAHGMLHGDTVRSATFMIGRFGDWREGMETYADNNAIVSPRRPWDKAMPVGWNSWGALAFDVNHTNSTEVVRFFADELQPHSFHNADGLLYTGLDSGWDSFSHPDLKDFADRCKANNQVPCIYWTPFTDWGKNPERDVPGTTYKYKDIYLYADGKPQELDGAYAIDPTHPATRKMMEDTAALFRRMGYKYVKMDFMTHGRMEADGWYDKSVSTGTEAYNRGMQLIDSLFSDMYINLSISPIFPAQYAQSRRIACDAWNKIKDTEYTMNALSWGWWIDRVYQFNDADHVVLRDATEGENRARITSSVITGLFITGDDFSAKGPEDVKDRARRLLTNAEVNALATGRSFRPLRGDDNDSEHCFVRTEHDGTVVLAIFNYTDSTRQLRLPLHEIGKDTPVYVRELWSHRAYTPSDIITLPAKDAMLFKIR